MADEGSPPETTAAAESSPEPSPMDVDNSAKEGETTAESAEKESDEKVAEGDGTDAKTAEASGEEKSSEAKDDGDDKNPATASRQSSSDGLSSETDTSDPFTSSSDSDDDEDEFESTPADPTERILQAVTHKEEGNTHFKSGDLSKASRSYRKGTSAIKSLNKNNTGDEQVKALLLSLQTNLSMVCYKQNKPKMSRDVATKALNVDSTNVKALYRRAAAHRKLGNIDAAKRDLKEALKHDPNNRDVKRELLSIKKAQDEQKKKQKASLSKQKEGLQKAFGGAKQGSFLYDDKEEEERKKKEAKAAKKKAEQEALKKRKAQWEDECVERMSNNLPAISFEDWDKERKKKEEKEEKERKRAKKEEEERKKAERKKAREAAKAAAGSESSDDDDLTEKEASMLRGYKKTQDGRTTSYFTRELTDEQKAMIGDIAPQRLDASSGSASAPVPIPSPVADSATKASAWNQAGTWEEKDTTEWCTERLKSHLRSTTVTSISHTANVTDVKSMTGDASVAVTSGKKRYIFDYHCEVEYDILDEGDDAVASGTLKLPDINSACLEDMEIEVKAWKKFPKGDCVSDVTECRNGLVDKIRTSVYSFVSDFNAQY